MTDNLFLFNLIHRWKRNVNRKNSYVFGEEDVDLEDFRDLVKQTFEVIKTAKNEHIFKNTYPEVCDVIDFIELISIVSQYGIDDQTVSDESKNCAFTATVLIAEELRLYANRYHFDRDGEKNVYSDEVENSSGDLTFELSFYVNLEDGEADRMYTYNVYDGNFDEILEFAKRIAAF